jgi:hypothetical protein
LHYKAGKKELFGVQLALWPLFQCARWHSTLRSSMVVCIEMRMYLLLVQEALLATQRKLMLHPLPSKTTRRFHQTRNLPFTFVFLLNGNYPAFA